MQDDYHGLKNPNLWDEEYWYNNVYEGWKKLELTFRALIVGGLICILLVAVNVYMGLKTGFGEGGSIIAAILGVIILKAFSGTILETNMIQTMGSAAGSVANIVTVIPAFIVIATAGEISGVQPMTWWQMFLLILSTSLLGVFFAIPLRRQIVIEEKLLFPSGTANADIMRTLHTIGEKANRRGQVLLTLIGISGLIKWFQEGIPKLIPAMNLLPGKAASYTLGTVWDPLLIGIGFLVGQRICLTIFFGALLTWGIIGPLLVNNGIVEKAGYGSIMQWTMWPGIAIMIASGLTVLLMKWRIVVTGFKSMMALGKAKNQLDISLKTWAIFLVASVLLTIFVMQICFAINWYFSLLAIFLSFLMAAVAIRALGETEINPISAFASISQFIFGVIAPQNVSANLNMAGIAGGATQESADMMQHFKSGWLVGATPWKQIIGQVIGVFIGAIAAVPMLLLVFATYKIGSEIMPAPAAIRYAGLAKLFATGVKALPAYTILASIVGIVIGIVLGILESSRYKKWTPSPIGLGVAAIIPFFYSFAIFFGSALNFLLKYLAPKKMEEYQFIIGASGIAGSSLIGMLVALCIWLGLISP